MPATHIRWNFLAEKDKIGGNTQTTVSQKQPTQTQPTSPTYGSPFDMMKQFGITYNYAGENIAKGQQTPQEVVNAWMNSAGHRANNLNSNYTYIGVDYVAQGNYWVQEFIGK